MIDCESSRSFMKAAINASLDEVSNAKINLSTAGFDADVRYRYELQLNKIRDLLFELRTDVKNSTDGLK